MSSRSGPAEPHTKVTAPVVDGDVQVELIPLFGDNYSYLLLHAATKTAALVDPADPAPIQRALAKHADYKLHTILTTHKHWSEITTATPVATAAGAWVLLLVSLLSVCCCGVLVGTMLVATSS